jgi:hypothetical protein
VSDRTLPGTHQSWFCIRRFLAFLFVWEIKTKRGVTGGSKAIGNSNNQAAVFTQEIVELAVENRFYFYTMSLLRRSRVWVIL